MTRWRVMGTRGCGSVIVEAALVLADIPYDREETDYNTEEGRARLLPDNPLAQVPTVWLPDGTVMTESLAILLHVHDLAPSLGLLPPVGDPLRPVALRYLAFVIAAIYPTFTYGDEPSKWVGDAGEALKASTDAHRAKLWRYLDTVAKGPWFLGERFSALDVYVGVMAQWRPGRAWFTEHTPKLHAIASEIEADPRLATLWADSF